MKKANFITSVTCLRYLPFVSDEDGLASPVHCVEHSRRPIRARRHQFGASGVKAHVEDLVVMPTEGVDALPTSDVPYLPPSNGSHRRKTAKTHGSRRLLCCVTIRAWRQGLSSLHCCVGYIGGGSCKSGNFLSSSLPSRNLSFCSRSICYCANILVQDRDGSCFTRMIEQ